MLPRIGLCPLPLQGGDQWGSSATMMDDAPTKLSQGLNTEKPATPGLFVSSLGLQQH